MLRPTAPTPGSLPRSFLLGRVGFALGLVGLLGCGGDDVVAAPVKREPPTFAITAPSNDACVSIGDDPASVRAPVIQLLVKALTLRPPGTCGIASPCGSLVLRVNGAENNRGAGPAIAVDTSKLAARFGRIDAVVEVLGEGGAVLDDGGSPPTPLRASVSFTTAARCAGDPEPDPGTGGGGDLISSVGSLGVGGGLIGSVGSLGTGGALLGSVGSLGVGGGPPADAVSSVASLGVGGALGAGGALPADAVSSVASLGVGAGLDGSP